MKAAVMLPRARIIASLLIIASSLTAGVFIVRGGAPKNDAKEGIAAANESLAALKTDEVANENARRGKIPRLLSQTKLPNATELAAQKFFEDIIARKTRGEIAFDGKGGSDALGVQTFIEEVIGQGFDAFDYESLKPVIPASELTLIETTPATVAAYLESFSKAVGAFAASEIDFARLSPATFSKIETALGAIARELAEMPVPARAATLHAEELSLVAAERNIFAALARAEEDPLAALLVIQAIPLLNDEFAALKRDFERLAREEGITTTP